VPKIRIAIDLPALTRALTAGLRSLTARFPRKTPIAAMAGTAAALLRRVPPKAAALAGAGLLVIGGGAYGLLSGNQHPPMIPRVVVPVEDPKAKAAAEAAAAEAAAAKARPAAINSPYDPVAMVPAPVEDLIEESLQGPLPRIGPNGRTPWQVYARPFVHDDARPRIALVVGGLGVSGSATTRVLETLPGPVTLAFSPHSDLLSPWFDQARRQGHEVLLSVPMEPLGFPRDDPGPNALLNALNAEQNVQRLRWTLSRVSGYVGATTLSGSRFTATPEAMRPILGELRQRGLIFFDSRTSPRSVATVEATKLGLPRAVADSQIDRIPSRSAIDAELRALENIARTDGVAVGLANPYPVTLERLGQWLPTLEAKGIVLAPITAVVNKQADR
jgi:uncharacterized protein